MTRDMTIDLHGRAITVPCFAWAANRSGTTRVIVFDRQCNPDAGILIVSGVYPYSRKRREPEELVWLDREDASKAHRTLRGAEP